MKKNDKKLFKLIILTIAVIAVLMILLPAYKIKDTDTVLKGYELAFGKELAKLSTFANAKIKFNIVLTLAYILPLGAGIIAVMMEKKEATLLSAILFLASGIMFVLAPKAMVVTTTVLGQTINQTVNFVMTSGAIVACGLSFFGVILSLYYYFGVK